MSHDILNWKVYMQLWLHFIYENSVWGIALGLTAYWSVLAIYRLWFAPIANFPGPKLAAATWWYEFYFDAILQGQYTFEIARMHQKYGPIVRINPYELHIEDPEYYEVLYSRDSPRNKWDYYTGQFGSPRSVFSAVDHYQHRLLRSSMNPYFSLARIRRLEPMIQALVDKLCQRLKELQNNGKPLVIQYAYTCFTTDVVSDYVTGQGFHYLDEADFIPQWTETLSGTAKAGIIFKPFPWLNPIMRSLPESWVSQMHPGMNLLFKFQRRCTKFIQSVFDENNLQKDSQNETIGRSNFVHDVLKSDLPPREKDAERLAQEIQILVSAGSETTAKALTYITFYLLNNPETMQRLQEELHRLDPDQTASLMQFEQMPYLNGVILEGLRLSYGVSTRLQRIAPDRILQYKEWDIPTGTPVSMTSVLMHHNETIFPNSYEFLPDRWVDLEKRKRLEKYMVAFSKGSRQCVGMHLAKSEMLLAIPKVFRRLKFELFETTKEDVTIAHEMFLAFPKSTSKGVRVLVKD